MSHIEKFKPAPVPTSAEDLPSWLTLVMSQLMHYLRLMKDENPVPEYAVEPSKPHYGMMVIADGTLWNPGSGRGIYWFDTDDTWKKL